MKSSAAFFCLSLLPFLCKAGCGNQCVKCIKDNGEIENSEIEFIYQCPNMCIGSGVQNLGNCPICQCVLLKVAKEIQSRKH